MSKEHLTYFKVENFKRFDTLELTDIGQFNLIVGDNNVGKTSVLEALLFDHDRKKCLLNLHKTLFLKGLPIKPVTVFGPKGEITEVRYPDENFLRYIFNSLEDTVVFHVKTSDERDHGSFINMQISVPPDYSKDPSGADFSDIYFTGITSDNRYIRFTDSGIYDFPYDEETLSGGIERSGWGTEIAGIYEHVLGQDISNWELPLVSTSIQSNEALPKAYFEQVALSRKAKIQLIEDMRFLLPDVEDFEVRKIGGNDQLLVGMKGKDELTPVVTFGESVIRSLQIMLEISKYKGKRLMIDEIDTGIHYSRMKNFLKTIFQVAHNNDVQLFMTTHSLECQQAFAEVFEDADMVQHQPGVRQFSLLEKPDGQVVASCRDFEQLNSALETGYDTRGGKQVW